MPEVSPYVQLSDKPCTKKPSSRILPCLDGTLFCAARRAGRMTYPVRLHMEDSPVDDFSSGDLSDVWIREPDPSEIPSAVSQVSMLSRPSSFSEIGGVGRSWETLRSGAALVATAHIICDREVSCPFSARSLNSGSGAAGSCSRFPATGLLSPRSIRVSVVFLG